ncbi:MAG: 3-dehydroquinate synthase [Gammaproteobacteria bacterium]|nr:3-dehydroquinate synthase [Gammaproteobacteria bacterium]
METLTVNLGTRSYPIYIGHHLLENGLLANHLPGGSAMVVSNETVAPLYMDKLMQGMPPQVRCSQILLPDGEAHKTLTTATTILDALVEDGFGRDACLIALGGGVVGDISGFAAACFQRGIDFIQVPTTLLAQVDASVGGKTGVNHVGGKNLIGAFHQPRCVLVDISTLETLSSREYRAGLAEVVKYGLVRDPEFLEWLEQHAADLVSLAPHRLIYMVRRCCEIKAEIVTADEREAGVRAILNFGHTFGHAIENAVGYGGWLHGEAVGVGMLIACDLSCRMRLLDQSVLERVRALLTKLELPIKPPPLEIEQIKAIMRADKKVLRGRLRFILLEGIGSPVISDQVPEALLDELLAEYFE